MAADGAPSLALTLPVSAGEVSDEIVLEAGHLDRLVRVAAHVAVRDGLLDPGEQAVARIVAGPERTRHGDVVCLEGCRVALVRPDGRPVGEVDFDREAFAAFAVGRAVRLLDDAGHRTQAPVAFSLHGRACADPPWPAAVPSLPVMSVRDLLRRARPAGSPAGAWIATFMSPAVEPGLEALARTTRASGLEAAGRIDARVGFDPARRCFVRVFERVVPVLDAAATSRTVRSSAGSWGEFLAGRADGRPRSVSSAHTHVHLEPADADGSPVISIDDVVTHYTAFPDPLAAAVVVSVYPDEQQATLYGYAPNARLRREPGWWRLDADEAIEAAASAAVASAGAAACAPGVRHA